MCLTSAGGSGCCLTVDGEQTTETGVAASAGGGTGGPSSEGTGSGTSTGSAGSSSGSSGTSTGQGSGGESPICLLDAGLVQLSVCTTPWGVFLGPREQATLCVSCSVEAADGGKWPICYQIESPDSCSVSLQPGEVDEQDGFSLCFTCTNAGPQPERLDASPWAFGVVPTYAFAASTSPCPGKGDSCSATEGGCCPSHWCDTEADGGLVCENHP